MKRKIIWLALGILIGMTGAYFYRRTVTTPPNTAAATQTSPAAPPEVAIEDGKTIDFSSGRAEVRETPEDRAALEKARREMEEAAREVKFTPAKPAPKPD